MDLVKTIKSTSILLRVQKARPVKAQKKTSIENDVNKAILSRGEEVVNPACCRILKEKVNYFSLYFAACVGAECVVEGNTALENEWVSTEKGNASHNKVCSNNGKHEHQPYNGVLQSFS